MEKVSPLLWSSLKYFTIVWIARMLSSSVIHGYFNVFFSMPGLLCNCWITLKWYIYPPGCAELITTLVFIVPFSIWVWWAFLNIVFWLKSDWDWRIVQLNTFVISSHCAAFTMYIDISQIIMIPRGWSLLTFTSVPDLCFWSIVSTSFGWLAIQFTTDIYTPLRMKCNRAGDLSI